MANRPCKPDADMKWLWQVLLPGTPMPVCGVKEDAGAKGDSVEPVSKPRHDAPTET